MSTLTIQWLFLPGSCHCPCFCSPIAAYMIFWSLENKITTCTVLIHLNKQMLSNIYFCFQSCLASFHTTTGHIVKDYWSSLVFIQLLSWLHLTGNIACHAEFGVAIPDSAACCSQLNPVLPASFGAWSHSMTIESFIFDARLTLLNLSSDRDFAFGMCVGSSVSTTWEPLRLTSRQLRSWKYWMPCIQKCWLYTVHRPHFGILVMLWHPVYAYFVFKGIHVLLLLHLLTRVCQKPWTKALWISGSSQGCSKTLPCKFDMYGGMLRRQDVRMPHRIRFLVIWAIVWLFSSQVESS